MLRLYRPWIAGLLRHRDAVIAAQMKALPGSDVFEDRDLEITGYLPNCPRMRCWTHSSPATMPRRRREHVAKARPLARPFDSCLRPCRAAPALTRHQTWRLLPRRRRE